MSISLSSLVSAPQLTLGTAISLSGLTAGGFTGIPAGVKQIQMIFQGVSASGTDDFLIRLGSGSYAATGYTSNTIDLQNTTPNVGGTANSTGFDLPSGNATTSLYGVANFVNITGNTWIASINTGGTYSTFYFAYLVNGSVGLSGALDRIEIVTSGTNTFDAGTVNITYQ